MLPAHSRQCFYITVLSTLALFVMWTSSQRLQTLDEGDTHPAATQPDRRRHSWPRQRRGEAADDSLGVRVDVVSAHPNPAATEDRFEQAKARRRSHQQRAAAAPTEHADAEAAAATAAPSDDGGREAEKPLFYSHLREVVPAQMAYAGTPTKFREVDKSKKRYCGVRYTKGPLVVTMTTVPPRIDAINHTLHKIYDQTLAPDEVILAVPSVSRRFNVPYTLPPKLQEFVDSGKLTLLQGPTDYGPATKLIPTVLELRRRRLPNAAIVVIDDDTYYSSHLLCEYVKASRRTPHAALGYRGFNFSERRRAELCGYADVPEGVALVQNGGASHSADNAVDVLTATGSIMVQLRQLDSLVVEGYKGCTPDAAQALYFNDDIWFNAHLARRGVPRMRLLWNISDVQATLPGWANGVHKKDAYVPYARGLSRLRPGALKQGPNANWTAYGSAAVMAMAPTFTKNVGGCSDGWGQGARFACRFEGMSAHH